MRVALLASERLSDFSQKMLEPILSDPAHEIVAAAIDTRPSKSLKQKLIKNLKAGRGGYMIVMAIKSFFAKRSKQPLTEELCEQQGIPVLKTSKPYSEKLATDIAQLKPDVLILVGGFGIVKEPLLSLAPHGVLSYHHGDMRKYRGMPPALWELYNGEKEMGVTVQVLVPGLDKGTPIVEESIQILPKDTLSTLTERMMEGSWGMMHKALRLVNDPDFEPEKIQKFGKVYTLPNLTQYVILQLKVLLRRIGF